ncbi:olfactory receptor 2AJ1-like [Choloepus didactylus]|uniref:olfactory receptor 2AJ1-like n=1 Tax=Choloepus didactylus TaxID=27675 RepID=UPI00189E32C1|nr:olfactory receptor 2AJ1-like [Choloepus didactylus]
MSRGNETADTDFIFLGLSPSFRYISFLTYIIFLSYIITVSGNSILILLIGVDSRLHTPMYLLLSHLSAMDLILISTTIPKMVTNFWVQRRTISQIGCGIQMLLYVTMTGSECLLLTLMSYNCYVAICNPLRYPVIMNPRVCLQMTTLSWVVGFLNSLFHTVYITHFPLCDSKEIWHFFCKVSAILKLSCEDTSTYEMILFVMGIVFLLIPFGLIFTSYGIISLSVFLMRFPEGQSKALATCSSHLTIVSLYFGSGVFLVMIPQTQYSAQQSQAVSLFYNTLIPMLNPIIYSLQNKEVLGALRNMLRIGVCSQIAARRL